MGGNGFWILFGMCSKTHLQFFSFGMLSRSPPSSPLDECCEMPERLVAFGSLVFCCNSQSGVGVWESCGHDERVEDANDVMTHRRSNPLTGLEWKILLHLFVKSNNFLPFFFLQGFYVFAVYFVMHNQLCWPTKASYTVEMNGHDRPDTTFQAGGPTTVGGDISKSTQNLISAMEEVSRV